MKKRVIKFCYRKIIDASSHKQWDQYVFESTYKEFQMQSQLYNQERKYNIFSEIINNVPASDRLHFLVSSAVIGYLKQLNGKIPDITNNIGKQFLTFNNYQFEIIESDLKNKQLHRVATNFYSDPMIWHDTVDDHLLLSFVDEKVNEDGICTHLLKLQPFLSIYSLKEEWYGNAN